MSGPRLHVGVRAHRQPKQGHILAVRFDGLDALRGIAVLWMTAFHFAFDLNHFGWIHQDFYRSPVWTLQRICIMSLFLLCAGAGQGLAVLRGQRWHQFWRRWAQIAACAALVSLGSLWMFPHSWIYFGVLHGMTAMLVVCRATASWGRWLWLAGALAVAAGASAPALHQHWPQAAFLDSTSWNWLGLVSRKPLTEDYVPVLPWLGVMWWGMALVQWADGRGWLTAGARGQRHWSKVVPLAWLGRWSLSWYMVHQPLLVGALTLVTWLQ